MPRLPHALKRPLGLLAVGLLAACSSTPSPDPEPPEPVDPLLEPASPEVNRPAPDTFKVLFETTAGDFVVEVFSDWAPKGAERFYNLVEAEYYDGVRFFRVIPDFVAQFGLHPDPDVSEAWSDRDARIPDDSVRVSNDRGTLTFATAGPETRTVQLFVNLVDNGQLDEAGFSPFGRVSGGMDSVDRIYDGYGEGAPRGDGPDQNRIQRDGEPYLAESFPRLDKILRVRVIDFD